MPFDTTDPRGSGPDPMPAWQRRTIQSAAAALLALSTVVCALGTRHVAGAFVAAFAAGDIHADAFRAVAGGAAVVLWAATAPYLLALAAGKWP